ncbi:MAG TPA: hypothetical protein VI729_05680, partial [Anaerolineales bacterium]|nr:hypothetical protein [Anaerolineales bacterium]
MSSVSEGQRTKTNTISDGAHPLLVLGAVVVIVLPAFVFLGARLLLPGDGAQLQFEPFRKVERGLLVNVNSPHPDGLRDGDRVIALAGRSVDQWIAMAFRGTKNAPAGHGPVVYTVLRNNEVDELSVALSRQPLPAIIGRNWTSYLFLTYLWAIGLVVFVLRPRQTSAQGVLLFSSLLMGSGLIFFLLIQPSDLMHGWLLPLWTWGALILYIVFAGGAIHFVLIFPSKRAVLRHRPSLPLAGYLGSLLLWVLSGALRWPEATTP